MPLKKPLIGMTLNEMKAELLERVNHSRVRVGLATFDTWEKYVERLKVIGSAVPRDYGRGQGSIYFYLEHSQPVVWMEKVRGVEG